MLVVALLGVLKAGAPTCRCDPGFPLERMRWIVERRPRAVLLTDAAMRDRPAGCRRAVVVDEDDGAGRVARPA